MSKRLVLVLIALLALPLALTACSSESQGNATDYTKAVLKGETEDAVELACESYQEETEELAARYGALDIANIDLKFDVGKGGDQKHITVTGSYMVGGEEGTELELAGSVRIKGMAEQQDTRIVVDMAEEDGDWCVEKFEDMRDNIEAEGETEAEGEDAEAS